MNVSHSDALVFFGATGDLTYKKTLPNLYAMERRGYLQVPVIGFARSDRTIGQFRTSASDSIERHGGLTKPGETMSSRKLTVDAELEKLQRETFGYFLHETNPANGLVIDKTAPDWPSSIAATGLALACYPVSVERGFMSRAAAVERTLATAFFLEQPARPRTRRDRLPGLLLSFS